MKKKYFLGITGSISAYKSADITNQLVKLGYQVDVIMTESSTQLYPLRLPYNPYQNVQYILMLCKKKNRVSSIISS